MDDDRRQAYIFGRFLLNPSEHSLRYDDRALALPPKAFKTLVVLVKHSGHLVEKDELLREVWPDSIVEEATLSQIIFKLRKLLCQAAQGGEYIETVPKCGYRFIAHVQVADEKRLPTLDFAINTNVSKPSDPSQVVNESLFTNALESVHQGNGGNHFARVVNAGTAAAPHNSSGNGFLLIPRWLKDCGVVLATIAAMGMLIWGYRLFVRRQSGAVSPTPFLRPLMTKITNTGNVKEAAISRDGKYVVYATEDTGRQSLYVRQLATNGEVRILPPSETQYHHLSFSPDGDFIYFLKTAPHGSYALYRVPLFGGTPKEMVNQLDSAIGWSPDGTQFAFVRKEFSQGIRQALLIAKADGTEERELAVSRAPEFITNNGPAWSPDGNVIACATGKGDSPFLNVIGVLVQDGTERTIMPRSLAPIENITWTSNGSGLLINTSEKALDPLQLWFVSYPGGEAQRITNDVSNYSTISLTLDSRTLVTVQKELFSSIWVNNPGEAFASASRIESGNYVGYLGLALAPDGRVVYSSNANGKHDIWIMNVDGTNRQQLTSETGSNIFPTVCADASTVIFVSDRTGVPRLWRMNLDGTQQRQLTDGAREAVPQCSPDAKSVLYLEFGAVKGTTIWKMPLNGGTAVRLTDRKSMMPAISPDGNRLAYYYFDEPKARWRIAVQSMGEAYAIQTLDMPASVDPYLLSAGMRWAPDGRALAYVDSRDGASNIWSLPLDGSASRQLTQFTDRETRIGSFEWSRDGSRLVFSRNHETSDVIMITDAGQ